MFNPILIQGGMGAGVSTWNLASTVSQFGQLGVVSGTALDTILARRLQVGDPGGHMRRAIQNFPFPDVAQRIMDRYFIEGGKPPEKPFKGVPSFSIQPIKSLIELTVLANFVEVFLAKEGHKGLIGINYLEKIQLPNLSSFFGAMLAHVDYVLMGAGIPRSIPGFLDGLANGEAVAQKINVVGASGKQDYFNHFDPKEFFGDVLPKLKRPKFLAIISSFVLALTLARKATGYVDGFVIEAPTAGGHNAPPRGPLKVSDIGEPIYGPKDDPDLEKIRELGRPFWLAGSRATPEGLAEALELGATGIQVGTVFAFCNESGIDPEYKRQILERSRNGAAKVFTDPVASPTGFPFKVVQIEGTMSDQSAYIKRKRICNLSYLRHLYRKEDGKLGYRCPSEPEENYLKKGGKIEDTVGRKCVCNGLMATISLGQTYSSEPIEKPLMTAGDDIAKLSRLLKPGKNSYTARDVLEYLLAEAPASV